MPYKYRRKPGSRRYIDYTSSQLQECLSAVKAKILTQREASERYRIPRSTIKNKLANKFTKKPGRPPIFTEDEEASFVAHASALSEYGFPLTDFDLRMIIKDYLSSQGRTVPQFKNNIPGQDWVHCFLGRHRILSRRLSNNIKRVRAQVSEDVITEFTENIARESENVPPENIFNYDETNLSDDPGRKKVICRRGSKYPECIVNATKTCFTVMFCGSASGDVVPPLIIYKAEHIWSTWTQDGPKDARYNRTKSGWIDTVTFEDWFLHQLMPILKKKQGRKLVIGDNLSSHINQKVLSECEKHDVAFVCLPPNATHILQPLDVAFFRPLKCKWRQVLLEWKGTPTGRTLPTLPKDQFPRLLKKTLDSLSRTKENLISGFEKTGIYPVNKEEPLNRLPRQDRIVRADLIADSFMQKLQQSRDDIGPRKIVKKKKMSVPPGKSIGAVDLQEPGPSGISAVDLQEAGPSGQKKLKTKSDQKKFKTKNAKKTQKRRDSISSTSCSDSKISLASSTEDHIITFSDYEMDYQDNIPLACIINKSNSVSDTEKEILPDVQQDLILETDAQKSPSIIQTQTENLLSETMKVDVVSCDINFTDQEKKMASKRQLPIRFQDAELKATCTKVTGHTSPAQPKTITPFLVEDYVLVLWNNQKYPGQIVSVNEEGALVSCMKRGKNFWRWPGIKDEQLYSWDNILSKISMPKFEKKGLFSIPELDG